MYRVPGVDAALVSVLNQRESLVFIQDPVLPVLGTVGHGSKNDLGDFEAGFAQAGMLVGVCI